MSPIVWWGGRTLARISATIVPSTRPSRTSRASGMCRPSSKISRASMARMRPPMSGMCEVVAEKATSRSRWKIGLRTETSLMWPVPIHASLVMRTSPGRIEAAPSSRLKWRAVAGRAPMHEGLGLAEVRRPLPSARAARAGALTVHGHLGARHGRAHGDTDVDELDRHVGRREREFLAVRRLERAREAPPALVAVVVGAGGKIDHEIEALAEEAAVGESFHRRHLELEPRVGHHRARL